MSVYSLVQAQGSTRTVVNKVAVVSVGRSEWRNDSGDTLDTFFLRCRAKTGPMPMIVSV